MPDDLARAIAARYRALGDDVPVAVRSSATAEDLPGASFAGQQDTYLNVVGADAVLDATRRCWASLWTERAVSYRATQGIDHAEVALAVVVQRMVDADVAGVMFTANPVTGNRRQLVVDASPGLGESVVSGAVNPDRFVLDATTGTAVEVTVGDKRTAVRSVAGGGTRTVDTDASAEPCLTAAQLRSLAALAAAVTAVYDDPQDTEWAIDADGVAWLTQARPSPPSTRCRSPAPGRRLRVFLCVSLAQGLTRPITPMGRAAFRLIGTSVATVAGHPPADRYRGPSGFVDAGQRIFVDITPILRHPRARRVAVRVAGVMEARTKAVLQHLEDDPRFGPDADDHRAEPGRSWPGSSLTPGHRSAWSHALISPAAALRRVDRIERAIHDRWRIPASATPTERLDAVEERLGTDTFLVMPSVFPYAAAGLLSIAVAQRLAPADLDPVLFAEVRRGLPHNVTTEMDLELWRLASRIGADPAAAAVADARCRHRRRRRRTRRARCRRSLQDGLADFLAGVRAPRRRRDRPRHAPLARRPDPPARRARQLPAAGRSRPRPGRQFADGAAIAEAAIDRIVGRPAARTGRTAARRRRPPGPGPGAEPGRAARAAEVAVGVRARGRPRRAAAGRRRRRGRRGASTDRDDIFFLDLPPGPAGARPGSTSGTRCARQPGVVRGRAAPPPRPAGAAVRRHRAGDADPDRRPRRRAGRQPGLGRHRHRARPGDPRSGRRPPGAGRDPRRPVDRSGLDPAVPDRRRSGDGDGRLEVARRRGRPGVRHPGRGRRARRHQPDQHRRLGHRRRRRGLGGGRDCRSPQYRQPPATEQQAARTAAADTVRRWFSRVQSLR